MARDDPHFRLRLPEDLRDKITRAAETGRRSINAEVVARLEASFSGPGVTSAPAVINMDDLARRALDDALEALLADPVRLKRIGLVKPEEP